SLSAKNFTPSSIGAASALAAMAGAAVGGQMLQGQLRAVTFTGTLLRCVSRFALSSTARLRNLGSPVLSGVQWWIPFSRPVAGCQVLPSSVETSTPPMTPPPASLAVPVMVTVEFDCTLACAEGEAITDEGGAASVEADAGVNAAMRVLGCTPISANRFTVACCMRSSGPTLPSGLPSRPHDHCTVPAPNTSAFFTRCSVK